MPAKANFSLITFSNGLQQSRSGCYILIAAWLGMQTLLLWRFGIFTQLESVKYITEADNILQNGTVSTPNFWLYSMQIFLIAAAVKLKTGYISVVIVQFLLNALATIAFFKLCAKLSNRLIAFWVTLVFICAFPYQTYNVYLQTESLFFSYSILFTYYLFSIVKLNWRVALGLILFTGLLCVTRPTGVLWIPGTVLYLTFNFFKQYSVVKKTLFLLSGAVLSFFLINLFVGSGGELDLMLPFQQEHIICGVPGTSTPYLKTLDSNPNSIAGLLYYVTHNFRHFLSLVNQKTFSFWLLYRTYYSTSHNAFLIAYFLPVIILAVAGLVYACKQLKPVALYFFTIILLTWLSVLLSCDDWHNRFFFTLYPSLLLMAAFALKKILVTKQKAPQL